MLRKANEGQSWNFLSLGILVLGIGSLNEPDFGLGISPRAEHVVVVIEF